MKKKSKTLKPKLQRNKIKHNEYLKSRTHKIIQWNCHGHKANYKELLLLIAELNPTAIYLQETFKKLSDKPNTFEQYNYINDTGQRASGRASILIRKNIPKNKININTHLQAVAI